MQIHFANDVGKLIVVLRGGLVETTHRGLEKHSYIVVRVQDR
jgi:hypothetical protein